MPFTLTHGCSPHLAGRALQVVLQSCKGGVDVGIASRFTDRGRSVADCDVCHEKCIASETNNR